MLTHAIAVLGLALGCAAWVALQRWMAKHHPEIPGVEKRLTGCRSCEKSEECDGETCEETDGHRPKLLPVARVESRSRSGH